ncbi:MAG: hypothetical protein K2X87_32300 [Gemmataceae bacterium]|nr:hypothetical protein [Gemmataceae bacterium]
MTADNFDNTLKVFRERTPFRPFTVVLHSGRQFEVDHPGALVHRDGVAIFVGPGGVPVIFDYEGVEHFVGDLADRPAGQEPGG